MQIGMMGLGRMGANIARRLMRARARLRGPRPRSRAGPAARGRGRIGSRERRAIWSKALGAPRVVWLMLPAGAATEAAIGELGRLLAAGDTIIDGGNTFWKDDIRRARELEAKGLHYLDVGTSGGVWGLERGYCLMIGGEKAVVDRLDPHLRRAGAGQGRHPRHRPAARAAIRAPSRATCTPGPSGAGHFVKMIHNGIEYGMMQAIAEGFDILKNAGSQRLPQELRLAIDVADVAEVVAARQRHHLVAARPDRGGAGRGRRRWRGYSGHVEDSGEGRWTVQAAIEEAVPAEVLTAALYARFRSRQDHTFAEKVLSAMRKGFGGHVEPKVGKTRVSP